MDEIEETAARHSRSRSSAPSPASSPAISSTEALAAGTVTPAPGTTRPGECGRDRDGFAAVDGRVRGSHERGEQSRDPVLAAAGELPVASNASSPAASVSGRLAASRRRVTMPLRVACRVKAGPGFALRVQPSFGHAALPWVRPMLSAIWRRCSLGNR